MGEESRDRTAAIMRLAVAQERIAKAKEVENLIAYQQLRISGSNYYQFDNKLDTAIKFRLGY